MFYYSFQATFVVQLYQDPVNKQVKINNFGGFMRDLTRPNAGFTLDGDGQTGNFRDAGVLIYIGRCASF